MSDHLKIAIDDGQMWWGVDGRLHFIFPGTDEEWAAIPLAEAEKLKQAWQQTIRSKPRG